MSYVRFDQLQLSRHAYNPRDRARAGDLWRIFQDAAVLGSSACGWDPQRYREAQVAFVVRSETAVHARNPVFGERLQVETWVSDFRGGRFSNRQVRVTADGEPISACTQEWLHVRTPELRIARASAELRADLSVDSRGGDVVFPEVRSPWSASGSTQHGFAPTFGEMDPLGHANHPRYVDWCDEALSHALAEAGLDPHGCTPLAEQVHWKAGVEAPESVTIDTVCEGLTADGHPVFSHAIRLGDGRIAATARTVRTHDAGSSALAALWTP